MILRRAPNSRSLCLQALRGCLLLHFAAADLEDARGSADGARRVYEGLVAGLVAKSDLQPPRGRKERGLQGAQH